MRKVGYSFVWLFVLSIPTQQVAAATLVEVSGTISRLFGLAAALVASMALVYEGRMRPFSVAHGIIVIFLAWGALSFLWTTDETLTFARLSTNVQLVVMVMLFTQFGSEKKETHGLVVAYVIGASLSLLELFRQYSSGISWEATALSERYSAFDNNPNDFAVALAIGIPMAYYLVLENRRRWEVLMGYAFYGLGALGVVLTGSRGGLIAAVFALLILPLSLNQLSHSRKVMTLVFCVVAAAVGVQLTPERVWSRLETLEEFAPDATPKDYYGELEGPNIRTIVWKQGMKEFLSNPQVAVVGVGAGAYRAGVEPLYGERFVAHNVFISILVEQGIVGIALFVAILYLILSPIRYLSRPERFLWLFTFLAWAVGVSFISWEETKNTWFIIGLLAARMVSAKLNVPRKPGLISSLMGKGMRLHTR